MNATSWQMPTMINGTPLRSEMFAELPQENEPLAKLYQEVPRVHWPPGSSGKSFDFYQANLARKYGQEKLIDAWMKTTVARFRHWGINYGHRPTVCKAGRDDRHCSLHDHEPDSRNACQGIQRLRLLGKNA